MRNPEQVANQQIFLDTAEKWGLSSNCHPENWKDRQAGTEDHCLPEAEAQEQNPAVDLVSIGRL